jgi:hypothetical protein
LQGLTTAEQILCHESFAVWGEAQTWGRAELDECQDMRCMPWSVLRI